MKIGKNTIPYKLSFNFTESAFIKQQINCIFIRNFFFIFILDIESQFAIETFLL